jgi:hypothetical protein
MEKGKIFVEFGESRRMSPVIGSHVKNDELGFERQKRNTTIKMHRENDMKE